jgi:FAD/FMN-containing dehydrogenase
MLTDLYRVIVALGGTITGEHGIGSKRASYLPLVQDAALIALERRVKAAFDPLGILNPGKIFSGSIEE